MYAIRSYYGTAPFLIGLGLLEALDEETVLAAADPDDRDGDGISGRANWVWDFMWNNVFPAEQTYYDQLSHSTDYKQWTVPPIMEELKAKARAALGRRSNFNT